ncbi:Chromatin assembly factor 1 subunit rlf2 [Pleurostoma richardsiae]|uniref:Chromatin assembly factor 1 subunit rlf2 n=1 Tax=Pleurostoma richardsiae TaxID=41990 RepID=A0AA38VEE5_9PEZI|nr:Chromatin assembly factor 1 subunit rlf2 [Pleurostoma richardsiae]
MSANIQELESAASRKRSHEEFSENDLDGQPGFNPVDTKKDLHELAQNTITHGPLLSPVPMMPAQSPPAQSSPAALTDASSSTPARNSLSPNTPTRPPTVPLASSAPPSGVSQTNSQADTAVKQPTLAPQPPAKRKKLTSEEKEKKAQEEAAKKKEKEEARAAKAAERAKHEAEKKARQEEREKKKREKEEEERRVQEEKDKKARSQMKIGNFFRIGPSTPKKDTDAAREKTPRDGSPSPAKRASEDVSEYEKMFKPFFVKEQVTLASNPFAMDDETQEVKAGILDEYVRGARGPLDPKPFNPYDALNLPPVAPIRGRTYPDVRKIMSELDGTLSSKPIDLTTESQNAQIKHTRELLRHIPMKFLGFREDVRPPYFGTVTSSPHSGSLRKLARRPIARDVLPLNYDYDSEAEWQDDGDGEDVDILDDDEEDVDDDEEMGDFLDDSEDSGPARALFSAGMEPESTGLAWENRQRLGPLPHMYKYRMEFILDTLDHHSQIDPFSSTYWEPEPTTATLAVPGLKAKPTTTNSNGMAPLAAPADAFAAITSTSKADPKKAVVPGDMLDEFRAVVLEFPTLSKVGLVEMLSSKLPKCTKIQVRNTLDQVAERVNKAWRLRASSS